MDAKMGSSASLVESIFLAAVEKESPETRAHYLDEACGGSETALRREVERLLSTHRDAGSFLEQTLSDVNDSVNVDVNALGPVLADPPPIEGPGTVIGRYKLLEQIGEGGFAIVFRADQTHPVRRAVAVKIIKPGMDSRQVIARFEAERQALAVMDHPNVAKILDAGTTHSGRPYFVMELVKGVPVTRYCDEHRLTPRQRLELFLPVCQAVQHAHHKGIIHRDLKPSNVLISIYDGQCVPKVIDFGVAKATGSKLTDRTMFTGLGAVIGTPEYMSPEQAELNQVDIDTRSDVYSLGVLLYELLTGTTPLDRERVRKATLVEVLRSIREEEPAKPSTRLGVTAQLPHIASRRGLDAKQLSGILKGELDWIVMKALEKDRNRRYETATGLARDIQRYLDDEPVLACPPSGVYRVKKFIRRHTVGVLAGSAVVGALAVGLGLSTWLYVREKDARQQAESATAREREARRQAEIATAREMQIRLRSMADGKLFQAKFLARNRDHPASERQVDEAVALLPRMEAPYAADIHSMLGGLRAAQSRWKEAASSYSKAVELDPTDFEHYHWCVPALVQSKDVEAYDRLRRQMIGQFGRTTDPRVAERLIKDCLILPWPDADFDLLDGLSHTALKMGPQHWAWGYAQFSKALLEYRRGRFEQAAATAHAVLNGPSEDRNRHVQTFMVRAMALQRLSDPEAQSVLATGLNYARSRLPPEGGLLDYTGWNDWVLARALADEATTLIRGGAASTVPSAADRRREEERTLRATIDALTRRAATRPSDGKALRDLVRNRERLSRLLLESGRADDARRELDLTILACKQALVLGPDHWTSEQLGDALSRKGSVDEALAAYEEAVRLDPNCPTGQAGLAGTLVRLGKDREAIAAYKEAVRLKGDFDEAHNSLAWLLATAADPALREPARAVELAKRAVELAPQEGTYWNTLGAARLRAGDPRSARSDLMKSMELRRGGDAYDWFFLAVAYHQLGEKDEARKWHDQATTWTRTNKPADEQLVRFRAEAAHVLGVKE